MIVFGHLIRKTYHTIRSRNIETINSINYQYDIKPGDLFATKESLKHIFGFLSGYEISHEGTKLDLEEMNKRYTCFDQWVIKTANGKTINRTERNNIRSTLRQSRYSFIETWPFLRRRSRPSHRVSDSGSRVLQERSLANCILNCTKTPQVCGLYFHYLLPLRLVLK